ncbi:MAG: LPS export ABC transporter periplasmic protein LptC [Sphingomicrobium sp.]
MSEAATRERADKQRWALPGGAHDRLIKYFKIGLPMAVGVLIAVLALAPLDRQGDVSFILDKNKVQSAQERMRVQEARYAGTDAKGERFEIAARRAIQPTSDVPVVDIEGIFAQLALAKGPIKLAANAGRYNLDLHRMQIIGPIRLAGPGGDYLTTRDVTVDFRTRQVASAGPVSGRLSLGPFSAGGLKADLGERTVTLDGGARLKIEQGIVR